MAKYNVKFACGHEEEIELYGPTAERERKIKYFEGHGTCSACYRKEKYGETEEVEMSYREYKENYADCKTKSGSYDKKYKTIVVYVPTTPAAPAEPEPTEEEKLEAIAAETGYPEETVEKILENGISGIRKWMARDEKALVAAPDPKGRFKNAYESTEYGMGE